MSAHTLERKLAQPVVCTDCDYHGTVGMLVSNPQEKGPLGVVPLRCPMCHGARIMFIEHEAHGVVQ